MKKIAIEFSSAINNNSVGQLISWLGKLPSEGCDLILLISSSGGANEWARCAYSALTNLPRNVTLTTCGCGTVDSATISIFCSGQRRICLQHTRFLLHQSTWQINELVDLRRAKEIAAILQSDDESHSIAISATIGCPKRKVLAWITQGAVWNAEKAMKEGLVQQILASPAQLLDGCEVFRIYNA